MQLYNHNYTKKDKNFRIVHSKNFEENCNLFRGLNGQQTHGRLSPSDQFIACG